jgi:hypothetical protein
VCRRRLEAEYDAHHFELTDSADHVSRHYLELLGKAAQFEVGAHNLRVRRKV